MTYPSGRIVQYQPQANDPGKVGAVATKLNGLDQTLVQNIAYDPFGDIKIWGQVFSY